MQFKEKKWWKRKFNSFKNSIVGVKAEIALALSCVAGWTLVTYGIIYATEFEWVWYVSYGIFLLLLCGVKFLGTIFGSGLYTLYKQE